MGDHATASILGPAAVKIAAIQFVDSSCASSVSICACHPSSAMQVRPGEASLLPPHYEQNGSLGPDGDWLSKRARENQSGLMLIASPVELSSA